MTEVLGIQFAPLNIPLKRRLQTLATFCWFMTFVFGGPVCFLIWTYLLLFTKYKILAFIYMLWQWYDKDSCDKGVNRPDWLVRWVRQWKWWQYFAAYFPLRLVKTCDLDPNKNYLFCVFPHGVISFSAFGCFSTDVVGFSETFPGIKASCLTLPTHFDKPFFRELPLALGSCSSSAQSIHHLLSTPGGGRAAVLVIGGAAESLKARPRTYKLILKKRKGFIRIAIQNGSPLVPVISFGETDLYDQVDNPEGSWLRRIQDLLRGITGIAPVVPLGRGLFQYSFGIVPRRLPVTTVVGKPLNVQRIVEPNKEEIDNLHQEFVDALTKLFEENKNTYIKKAENIHLEIE